MADDGSSSQAKKRKVDEISSTEAPEGPSSLAIVPATAPPPPEQSQTHQADVDELVPRAIERLSLTVNPSYLTRLKTAGELGYERPVSERFLSARFYQINVANFRDAMKDVLRGYLIWKYSEKGRFTTAQIVTEVTKIVPICVDACMTSLYAKLRTIHKQYGTYSTRFNTPPTYSKDLELPLPFADAIQNFGIFETRCMKKNFLMIPVYPEGTKNEGREKEDWHAYEYEACMPILRENGIPIKNVDTRVKSGFAWWTYRLKSVNDTYDFECILPFLHYSEHSALLSSMFLHVQSGEIRPIIELKGDDVAYGVRLREVKQGFQLRVFSALCHAHSEEWNSSANID
nr:minor coat protein [Camellia cryptic virus 1]